MHETPYPQEPVDDVVERGRRALEAIDHARQQAASTGSTPESADPVINWRDPDQSAVPAMDADAIAAAQRIVAGYNSGPSSSRVAAANKAGAKHEIVQRVIEAGRDTAVLFTATPPDTPLKYAPGTDTKTTNFKTFGDLPNIDGKEIPASIRSGVDAYDNKILDEHGELVQDMVESVAFLPARVPNAATGQPEEGTRIIYAYNSQQSSKGVPYYTMDGRTGNIFIASVAVPEELAQELEAEMREDQDSEKPIDQDAARAIGRELAEGIALNLGDVSSDLWENGTRPDGSAGYRMKPPFEESTLPIHIVKPGAEPRVLVAQRAG